jgi:hypothetical protein
MIVERNRDKSTAPKDETEYSRTENVGVDFNDCSSVLGAGLPAKG